MKCRSYGCKHICTAGCVCDVCSPKHPQQLEGRREPAALQHGGHENGSEIRENGEGGFVLFCIWEGLQLEVEVRG